MLNKDVVEKVAGIVPEKVMVVRQLLMILEVILQVRGQVGPRRNFLRRNCRDGRKLLGLVEPCRYRQVGGKSARVISGGRKTFLLEINSLLDRRPNVIM